MLSHDGGQLCAFYKLYIHIFDGMDGIEMTNMIRSAAEICKGRRDDEEEKNRKLDGLLLALRELHALDLLRDQRQLSLSQLPLLRDQTNFASAGLEAPGNRIVCAFQTIERRRTIEIQNATEDSLDISVGFFFLSARRTTATRRRPSLGRAYTISS